MFWNRKPPGLCRHSNSLQVPPQPPAAFPAVLIQSVSPIGLAGYALAGLLTILLFLSFSADYLQSNLQQAGDFLFSPHFPFLCMVAILLCWKRVPESRYSIMAVAITIIYLALFYGEFLSLSHLSGDSVCQAAYWQVLQHPNLQGSIGVAFTKPGQVFYLGLLTQLSQWAGGGVGAYLFKAGLILAMAACVWSLVRIAVDLGGRIAGLLAFLLTVWAFPNDFYMSESNIYFIAALFSGLRLYFYQPKQRTLGLLLLVVAIQFRVEAIAILAVIWLYHALRKEWPELRQLTIFTLASLAIFLLVVFQIQGSMARLNSGAAAGYVSPVADIDSPGTGYLAYIKLVIDEEFSQRSGVRFLSIMTILGVAGAFTFRCKPYLFALAGLIVVIVNFLFLGGTFNLGRYVSFIYAFACSVGAASLVLFLRAIPCGRWRPLLLAIAGCFILALLLVFNYSPFNIYKSLDPDLGNIFMDSALPIINDENLPAGSSLLGEDDLLSYLVVLDPGRYRKLTSLQLFNVSSESDRKKILADSDYILFELGDHYFYYLLYLDDPRWRSDPFRLTIQNMLRDGTERTIYGYRLVPVSVSDSRVILKVEKS